VLVVKSSKEGLSPAKRSSQEQLGNGKERKGKGGKQSREKRAGRVTFSKNMTDKKKENAEKSGPLCVKLAMKEEGRSPVDYGHDIRHERGECQRKDLSRDQGRSKRSKSRS